MRLSRSGFLAWSLSLLILGLRVPHAPGAVAELASPSFPVALGATIQLSLLVVATWAAVVLGGCLLGGGVARTAGLLVPRALRGILLAGLVTGLGTGAAQADAQHPPLSHAGSLHLGDEGVPHRAESGRHGTAAGLDGLSLPDRPALENSLGPAVPGREPKVVLVAPGDTLWAIAARSLDHAAHDDEIASETRRWYRENRDVIGADPDLIRPGQRLVAPGGPS